MKKVLTSILIMLLLFNFIVCSGKVYAVEEGQTKIQNVYTGKTNSTDGSTATSIGDDGATPDGKSVGPDSYGPLIVGTLLGALSRLIDYLAFQVDILMSMLTYNPDATSDPDEMFWFSIDKTVFNRVALFNINYFSTEDYTVGDRTITADSNNTKIKEGITISYYVCRILALAISLLVLIYIGIRMAISTVASDQAKYKKMLVSWLESIVILFLMPYIMSIFFALGESLTNIFYNIRTGLLEAGNPVPGTMNGVYGVFEETIRKQLVLKIFSISGLNLAVWSLIYWALLFTEVKFLWLYLKRLLMVGFLIVISPIITITYSIDKVGDGKAQAFSTWLKEFILNVLIQPLHALLYIIFVFSANAIASTSPIVALALLMAMGQAERMVKVIFDMKGSVTLRGVNKFLKKEG